MSGPEVDLLAVLLDHEVIEHLRVGGPPPVDDTAARLLAALAARRLPARIPCGWTSARCLRHGSCRRRVAGGAAGSRVPRCPVG
jgi:hypothetical protein